MLDAPRWQEFLPAACKALEEVDVVCHKTRIGEELRVRKAADNASLPPDEMKARTAMTMPTSSFWGFFCFIWRIVQTIPQRYSPESLYATSACLCCSAILGL